MLSCNEIAQLACAIVATAETLGQELSAGAADLMANDLAEYPANAIRSALKACRRELTGKLTLAAILQRVHAFDGRPEPNEAWAIALQSFDESETVLLTQEIQQAAIVATPVFHAGDKVGARMAFLAAYGRLVDTARRDAQPVEWHLSLGFHPERRAQVVEDAARLGRLPVEHAQRLLASLRIEPVSADGRAIAGLITGRVEEPSVSNRERIAALREQVLSHRRQRDAERKARVDAQKQDMAERIQRHNIAAQELQARLDAAC